MAEKHILRMILPQEQLPAFSPLLQRGVWLRAQTGCSVASLLSEQFGIAADYVIERVTTLFLDFKPVDDLETAYVHDGSTLALSSAMPGLVGTTMRRGSHLAAMRGDISCRSRQRAESKMGRIRVKLFNLLITELGATLLAQGIQLSNAELKIIIDELDDNFWQDFGVAILDGRQIDPAKLKKLVRSSESTGDVLFKVEFRSGNRNHPARA